MLINQKTHIPQLDGLRGIAILMVMFHHFTILESRLFYERAYAFLAHQGGHGVDLFFVLSGFLITGILLESKGKPDYFKNFYARRALRIFPLYYIFIILLLWVLPPFLASAQAVQTDLLSAQKHWPWYFFYGSNFWIMVKAFYYRGGIDISWSLAIEEQFYLLWPLIVARLKTNTLIRTCLGLILLAFFCRIGILALNYKTIQMDVFTLSRMDSLALGAIIALLFNTGHLSGLFKKISSLSFIFFELTLLGMLLIWKSIGAEPSFIVSLRYSLIAFLCAQVLLAALYARPESLTARFLSAPPLIFFGKYSYALYLFHIPAAAIIRQAFFSEGISAQSSDFPILVQFTYYTLCLAAVVPCALLSWYFLEKPILAFKRHFYSPSN